MKSQHYYKFNADSWISVNFVIYLKFFIIFSI